MKGKLIEIQIRTALQHLWADLSEKSSDLLGQAIKYGRGDQQWRHSLAISSESIADLEEFEQIHIHNLRLGKETDAFFRKEKPLVKKKLGGRRSNPKLRKSQKAQLKSLEREKERLDWKDNELGLESQRKRKAITDTLTQAIADLDQRREQMK